MYAGFVWFSGGSKVQQKAFKRTPYLYLIHNFGII
jgi:hypothetical protein